MIQTLLLALLALIVFLFVISIYKKCPADKLLVTYGLGGNKVHSGKGKIIIPILQGFKFLSLTPMNLDIELDEDSGVVSRDKIRLVIEGDATFAISKNEEERKIAAERLLSMDVKNIKELVTEILTGQLRSIVSELNFQDLLQDRKTLMSKVSESTEQELNKFGLDILNFNIKMIRDLDGIVEQLGKKASAIATSDAMIATAEQEKNASTSIATHKKQQETNIAATNADKAIAIAETETNKSIKIAEREAQKAIQTAEFELQEITANKNKETKTAQISAETEKQKQLVKINTEKEVNLKKIEIDKEVQITAQQNNQEIAESEKVTVVKQAEVDLEKKRAVEIVEIKVATEKREAEEASRLRVEKMQAENELMIAGTKAEAIIKEAEAKAKALKLEAEGKAALEALPLIEKAKAEKALLDVYGADNLIKLKLIEAIPALANAQAEAVKGIKIDSINVISGGEGKGAVGGEIGQTVNNIISSIPAFKMANDLAKSVNMPELNLTAGSTTPTVIAEEIKPKELEKDYYSEVEGY